MSGYDAQGASLSASPGEAKGFLTKRRQVMSWDENGFGQNTQLVDGCSRVVVVVFTVPTFS